MKTKELVLCALFATLIMVGAFIRIPIPVIPFTLQFLFTNLAGLLLGKKLGCISVGVYILAGLAGAPVFTAGGGIGYIFYPTFGYLIGFLFGAYFAGRIVEGTEQPSFKLALAAGGVNLAVVYLFGIAYYYMIANYYLGGASSIGAWALVLHGFVIVVPGDILICFASAAILRRMNLILEGRVWGARRS